mmetsp:Transcript_7749/g.10088  ORF Transcript_7749/g.10088 Transcript_7749/m.10088 type:complete len:130 (-) Transcript_7749:172-561(-)
MLSNNDDCECPRFNASAPDDEFAIHDGRFVMHLPLPAASLGEDTLVDPTNALPLSFFVIHAGRLETPRPLPTPIFETSLASDRISSLGRTNAFVLVSSVVDAINLDISSFDLISFFKELLLSELPLDIG